MNTPSDFEAEFGELGGYEMEWEDERRPFRRPSQPRTRVARRQSFSPAIKRPALARPRPHLPRRWPRPSVIVGRRRGWLPYEEPLDDPKQGGTEYARWVQSCLNRILNLRLPVTGVIDAATRSAVRNFQTREHLTVDGIVGPPTETALTAACRDQSPGSESELELEAQSCGCGGAGPRGQPCACCGGRAAR